MKQFNIVLTVCLIVMVISTVVALHINAQTIKLYRDEVDVLEQITISHQAYNKPRNTIEVCSTSTFKSYMPYRAITDKTSDQYALQQQAETEYRFGLRTLDDYFMVAVTSQYGNVGDILEIEFEDNSMLAIIGDIKGNGHDGCQSLRDGSVIEFIVDMEHLDENIKQLGNFNVVFTGSIKNIYNLGNYKGD